MNIKRLTLEHWMKSPASIQEILDYSRARKLTQLELTAFWSKFNYYNMSDGYYLYGDKCWFQCKGEGWEYDAKEQFKYDLDLKTIPYLTETEEMALITLVSSKLASKKQVHMLRIIEDRRGIREVGQRTRLRLLSIKRKLKDNKNG